MLTDIVTNIRCMVLGGRGAAWFETARRVPAVKLEPRD
jgi:hypothetical protein